MSIKKLTGRISLSTFLFGVFTVEDQTQEVSNGHAAQIQDNIVYIKTAQQSEKLHRFDKQNDTCAGGDEQKEIPESGPKPYQPKTDRDKQQHITGKIDDTMPKQRRIAAVPHHIPIIFDGQKRCQIYILLQHFLVGQPIDPALRPSKQQPKHHKPVDHKKEPDKRMSGRFTLAHVYYPRRFLKVTFCTGFF